MIGRRNQYYERQVGAVKTGNTNDRSAHVGADINRDAPPRNGHHARRTANGEIANIFAVSFLLSRSSVDDKSGS